MKRQKKGSQKGKRQNKGKIEGKTKAKKRQTTITGGTQKGDMIGRKKTEKKGRTKAEKGRTKGNKSDSPIPQPQFHCLANLATCLFCCLYFAFGVAFTLPSVLPLFCLHFAFPEWKRSAFFLPLPFPSAFPVTLILPLFFKY